MAIIRPDPISLTTHHLHLCFAETNIVLASGTGFIYERSGVHYLITNWHNVTGKNPLTGEYLSESKAVPDIISTMFRKRDRLTHSQREVLRLYSDTQMHQPAWFEHPRHGRAVDVVALPIPEQICSRYQLSPINEISFNCDYKEEVADDTFVIGYPFSETIYLQLPIWKRASIASEPDVDLDSLPKMFIDSATRPGLSGSPVVMQRTGIHMTGDVLTDSSIIGRIRNFVGIYSGRIGADELKAQLGIVWKARVISEIIDSGVLGRPPYEI